MRQALAIFMSVIFAFVGFMVGAFVGGNFFADSKALQTTCAVVGALLFAVGTYFHRRDKEQCKKCGALWSVRHASTETLSQNVVNKTETKKYAGQDYTQRKYTQTGRFMGYGDRYETETTTYLVGEEKLVYRCNKCGNETSKIKKFKRLA